MLDAIEEGVDFGDVAEIAIEPPEVHAETNQDSGDEEPDPDATNKLTGFQLRAQAHLLREIMIRMMTQIVKIQMSNVSLN